MGQRPLFSPAHMPLSRQATQLPRASLLFMISLQCGFLVQWTYTLEAALEGVKNAGSYTSEWARLHAFIGSIVLNLAYRLIFPGWR